MLIVMELRESPKEIWLNWKKKLVGIRKVWSTVSIEAINAENQPHKNKSWKQLQHMQTSSPKI